MHLHARQLGEDVRHLLEARPVELQVLARREMTVGAVVLARDRGELPQLPRREQAIGNGDAQHRRVALDVEAVAQPQGAKLLLRQLPGEEAIGLAAELRDPLVNQPLVYCVVAIHSG